MTFYAASNAADFYASVRPVLRSLFEEAHAFATQGLNANERANAYVKSLEIITLERRFFDASTPDDWRRRVETTLASLQREISTVGSRAERAYLRRLALDAALKLNAYDSTFFIEPFVDAQLAEIDESEERQNALVVYATRLANRISRFPTRNGERAKAFALLEEIEDLRLFERAAADVVAAVLFNATQCDESTNVAAFETARQSATLNLAPFGSDVAETWAQFESFGGFLELCERASVERLASLPPVPPTTQEIAFLQALNDETRRRLEAVLASLDSGLAADGSPLTDSERAELQSVVDEAVIASPFALKNGVFFRAFLERSRNLKAFVSIFERLTEAENALNGDVVTVYKNEIYRGLSIDCAEEKKRWLESARRVATRSSTFEANLGVKLDRLTTLAELEFSFGDKTNGKNAVRETLATLPCLESPFERAQIYRRLVVAHIGASYLKAAQKLAHLWKKELDAIEPEDLRNAALADAFNLYAQAVKNDATELLTFAESISSSLARLDVETRSQLVLIFSQETESMFSDLTPRLINLIKTSVKQLQSLDEIAPDEAVFTLVKIATGVAERFADVSSGC
ncbi:MAG: hypothetical protein IKY61_04615 [Thermoguttaceae bacterium]|nr:hypothetical protein [Thermoguttaceae bacterium]